MTDLQKLISIIDSKIEYEIDNNSHNIKYPECRRTVTIYNTEFPILDDREYYVEWLFDKDGNFVAML
jgi:hypothetical protein